MAATGNEAVKLSQLKTYADSVASSVTIPDPLPIKNGGTNGDTVGSARYNLGTAAAYVNGSMLTLAPPSQSTPNIEIDTSGITYNYTTSVDSITAYVPWRSTSQLLWTGTWEEGDEISLSIDPNLYPTLLGMAITHNQGTTYSDLMLVGISWTRSVCGGCLIHGVDSGAMGLYSATFGYEKTDTGMNITLNRYRKTYMNSSGNLTPNYDDTYISAIYLIN